MYSAIQNLHASLSRAGGHLTSQFLVRPYESHNGFYIAFRLQEPVGKTCQRPMKDFMRQYLRESGWRMRGLKLHRSHLEFDLSSAKAK